MPEPTTEPGRLSGRVALITGASRGIGAAVAQAIAGTGAHVILLARDVAGLTRTDDAIRAAGFGSATLLPLDLMALDEINKIGFAITEKFGRLDILIGAAGTLGEGLVPVHQAALASWQEIFAVNFEAHWRLLIAVDALLRTSDAGRVIFVTDAVSSGAEPFWGPYAASKAALETMVKTYAAETRNTTLKANLIDPGPVATRLRAVAFPGEDKKKISLPEQVSDIFLELADPSCRQHGQIMRLY